MALDAVEFLVGDLLGSMLADRFEDILDIELLTVEVAGECGPAVEEHGRDVEPSGGHDHAGERLVAPGERDHAVQTFTDHHRLDGVRDHLARDEGRAHPVMTHRDGVRDADGRELQGETAMLPDTVLRGLGELREHEVAGCELVP